MYLAQCGCGWKKKDSVAGRAKRSAKLHEKENPYHATKVTKFMEPINLSGPNLANASAIKANAEKLLEDQKRVAEAQHTLQSAYFDLRRIAGESAANRFVASLMIVPF